MKKQAMMLLMMLGMLSGCVGIGFQAAESDAKKVDDKIDAWIATLPAPDADYGAYPTNYEEIIKSYFNDVLKDPESARYSDFSLPRQEHAITNARNFEAIYGYSSCVFVNAKNSYGGYVGKKRYWVLIRNGKLVRGQDTTREFPPGDLIYRGRTINCADGAPLQVEKGP